ncbi:endonuclease g [Anaeramoeba ignava]|uniref:Endonuclease g n=1 Tax=Anaeramoeba ignava TaxID=1746090 RepID=A0A9Q0LEV3_ANAIG|nr:endonuclease g [Anaeramoeba ignava]
MIKFFLIIILITLTLTDSIEEYSDPYSECESNFFASIPPKMYSGNVALCKNGYAFIAYDVDMKNPALTAYYWKKETLYGGREGFKLDTELEAMGIAQAPVDSSCWSQDWNRGHLKPSDGSSYNLTKGGPWDMTYIMSNVAPQAGTFNEGSWSTLEGNVVNWIQTKNNPLYIITGVAYKDRSNPIRRADNIAQPDYYYKVICDPVARQSAGFYACNLPDSCQEDTKIFRTVAEVETLAQLTLFDTLCNKNSVDESHWW